MATNNNEFFDALAALEKERGLPADYLIDKIKAAIVIAVKKDYEVEDDNVVVDIDPNIGAFRASLLQDIVEEVENPHTQVSLEDAQKIRKTYKVGQRLVTPLKTKEFGRIAAQTAKHVIRQGLREGERSLQCSEMQSRAHEIITGTVTAVDASGNIGRASVDIDSYNVDHKFSDINDYWAATYVDFLYNSGVTTGYDDGTFRPEKTLTREQMAVMLARYYARSGVTTQGSLDFADAAKISGWAVDGVSVCVGLGLVQGDPRGRFLPQSRLTRAQIASILVRMAG